MDAALPTRLGPSDEDPQTRRRHLSRYLLAAQDALNRMEIAMQDSNILGWTHALQELKLESMNAAARRLIALCLEAEHIRAFPDGHAEAMLYHLQKELMILRGEVGKLL